MTIRRFADLVSPSVRVSKCVIDLGCGVGEITCELARRFPHITFQGIDHSQAGIARAREYAQTLRLSNVGFFVADAEEFEPKGAVDLVMMFDAFHHLVDPTALILRWGAYTNRFVLVEPKGDWKGSWDKRVNFDWLVRDLDNIRARIAHILGERQPAGLESIAPSQLAGEPTEYRYSLDDFEHFFKGYGLEVRGTVAGLESYPPLPDLDTPSRERFGRLSYDLYRELDDLLLKQDLDLLAKHLVIYAERGRVVAQRTTPNRSAGEEEIAPLRGPYDVHFVEYSGPSTASPNAEVLADVVLRNESWRRLTSADEQAPDFLSYHWLDRRGSVVQLDGVRSALPRPVSPGEKVKVAFKIRTPKATGKHTLAIDLVREGVTWYSDSGNPCLRIAFRIR